ncbi:MAG: hypothetical protein DWQ30_13155, partial [Acidobacteria bacterium]
MPAPRRRAPQAPGRGADRHVGLGISHRRWLVGRLLDRRAARIGIASVRLFTVGVAGRWLAPPRRLGAGLAGRIARRTGRTALRRR